jgi:adenylate cyclase
MNAITEKIFRWVETIGMDLNDDDEIRLQKKMLVICALIFAVAAAPWGVMYFIFDQPMAAAIPLSYSLISLLSIVQFKLTRRYHFFRFSQLLLILLLPFFLMMRLGGFFNGSAVIIWGFLGPLGALLFDLPRRALYWFLAYSSLVIVSGFIQPSGDSTVLFPLAFIYSFFVANVVVVGALIFTMLFYFVAQKNMYQEKSETLLLNILPKEIVCILKNNQCTIADQYDGVSILFADVVNFTPMSASMKPTEIVGLLNEVFSYFDSLVEQYGLEKIKTIGDCYMVASGVPRQRTDHAQSLVRLALEFQDWVKGHSFNGRTLEFRIGINSGPVVAGVIGTKKFIYDLWGDAVNTASRMESHGQRGTIQITRATYDLVKDEFECESRGTVSVKGKGEMEIWHVVKEKYHVFSETYVL